MTRHSISLAISATMILSCFSSILLAQGCISSRHSTVFVPVGPRARNTTIPVGRSSAASSQSPMPAVSAESFRAEIEAISKAKKEGRLQEAEKLLNAAIAKAEGEPPSRSYLSALLNELADLENLLHHHSQAVAAEKRAVAADQALGPRAISRVMMDLQELVAYAKFGGDCATFAEAATEQLALARRYPGPQNNQLLRALSTLAVAYHFERREADARIVQTEEVRICEAQPEPHSSICVSILAEHYRDTGHAGYAEQMLAQRAAQTLDSSHGLRSASYWPKVSQLLQLSRMYEADHSYDLAAETDRQMIAVIEHATKDPVQAAAFYDSLGLDLQKQGKDNEAEDAFKHSFDLRERATGRLSEGFVGSLGHTPLVSLYRRQGRMSDAEAVLKRALADQRKALKPNDATIAYTLVQLAEVELRESEYSEAEPFCERALKIQEADYGPDNFQLVRTLSIYARVERQLHNIDKADALAARAAALRQKARPNLPLRP
jgi:tetratricopeptide (TPR) repeat protein